MEIVDEGRRDSTGSSSGPPTPVSSDGRLRTNTSSGPASPSTRLVVDRTPSALRKSHKEYAKGVWEKLKEAILFVYGQQPYTNKIGLCYEELYRNSYNLVIYGHGSFLYRRINQLTIDWLQPVRTEIAAVPDEGLLSVLFQKWAEHQTSTSLIRDVLMYMDRIYVPANNLASIYECGVYRFCEEVLYKDSTSQRVTRLLMSMIAKDRNGDTVDRDLLSRVTRMLMDLGVEKRMVYEVVFEEPFLEISKAYYEELGFRMLATYRTPGFLKKTEALLFEEALRVEECLDLSSGPKIAKVVETQLLRNSVKQLIENPDSGLAHMLREVQIEDLSLMYRLLRRVPDGLTSILSFWGDYCVKAGMSLVDDPCSANDPRTFVSSLATLRSSLVRLLTDAFENESRFSLTVNSSFEHVINVHPRAAEFLSLYIDSLLRLGLKHVTETEFEQTIDSSLLMIRFLHDKDVFERYYKTHTGRRLLQRRAASEMAERMVIAKLRNECGYQFAYRLQRMITDMNLSADLFTEFRRIGMEFSFVLSVTVLTSGVWSVAPVPPMSFPAGIEVPLRAFEVFFEDRHRGRKLTWHPGLGTGDVRAMIGKDGRRHDLSVSTQQMVILLMFNQMDEISFAQIVEESLLPPAAVKRQVMGLLQPKHPVLVDISVPVGKVVSEASVFRVNEKFTSKFVKIKISSVPVKETEVERKETQSRVDDDRKFLVEATLIRVMKSRKKMPHAALIAETTEILHPRFVPNPTLVKKRIEDLINREYLERSQEDRGVIVYKA